MNNFSRSFGIFSFSFLILFVPATLSAQTLKKDPAQSAEFKKRYADRVRNVTFKTCVRTASGVEEAKKVAFCECYSNAYVDRYDYETLSLINQWAMDNPDTNAIIPLMLLPERANCQVF